MSLKLLIAGLSAAAFVAPLPVGAQSSIGYRVSLSVAVHCQVRHSPAGAGDTGGSYSLGRLTEFCNAPAGYDLRVQYTPGALQGMLLMVGDRSILLDGSGQALINGSDMPRIQERPLAAIPSSVGFNTDRLEFDIVPR